MNNLPNWTDEYREIVEFYFWEPQHIGRANSGKKFKSADEMYAHINSMEVSLNHILNIFFSLYSICNLSLFEADELVVMLSAWQLEEYARAQQNATQPDLFFVGNSKNIAIELKTKSKSSLDQVIKYVKFSQDIQKEKYIKPLDIYFIAYDKEINKLFKEKFNDISEIYEAISSLGLPVPNIRIIDYQSLYDVIRNIQSDNPTEKRLISGLVTYMQRRSDELKIQK